MDLIDKTVELRGSQILNMNSYKSIVYKRRCMAFATFLAWIGVVLMTIALSTSNWSIVHYKNEDFYPVTTEVGTWGEWRKVNKYDNINSEWIPHFTESKSKQDTLILKNYYRAQAVMGVISLIFLLITNLLAIYTFYHHRYMFKRVVACLYVVDAMAVLATIEILSKGIDGFREEKRESDSDNEVVVKNGLSTYLALGVIMICIFAALSFAIGSHKQKGENAATAELEIEDREYHIGR